MSSSSSRASWGFPFISPEFAPATREGRTGAPFGAPVLVLCLLASLAEAPSAQQLEPRAYEPAPVGLNTLGVAYTDSSGSVGLDPAIPLKDVTARIHAAASYYGRTFGAFGRQAGVLVVVPYAWGKVEGDLTIPPAGHKIAEPSGLADPSLRLSMNIVGGPALNLAEFRARPRTTVLGASLAVVAPLGQYNPQVLINLGQNRWAFKPELGLSQPFGPWRFEAYAGGWFYTDNTDYFGGHLRRQDPLLSIQSHVVYDFRGLGWAAADFTYFGGGATELSGRRNADRQDNTRTGVTLAVPVGKAALLKGVFAHGTSARIGSDLDTYGLSLQVLWF